MARAFHIVSRSKRRLTFFGALVVLAVTAVAAIAFFTATGTGAGTASTGTLNAPTLNVPTPGAGTVALSWSTVSPPTGSDPVTYYVTRDGGNPGGNCPTAASPTGVTSCTDSGLTAGTYHYTVTAKWHSWTATSNLRTVVVASAALDHFAITPATGTQTAGTAFSVTVTAKDASNNTVTTYTGTIHFTSNDGQAVLPSDYTFVSGDNGSHTFASGVTLKTAGTGKTVSVADGGATGTAAHTVVHADASQIVLSGLTSDLASGSARTYTATIEDAYGNTVDNGPDSGVSMSFAQTGGSGSVTGTGSATASGGVATKSLTGNLAGPVTIRASATLSIAGATNSNALTFNVVHGAASQIVLSGSTANLASGTSRTFTATIEDAAGNTITDGPDSTDAISFSQTAGTGSVTFALPSATLGGIATDAATGVTAGSVTIRANATLSGSGSTNSNPLTFNVVVGTATKLVFTQQPTNTAAGSAITPAVTVSVEDANSNVVTTDSSTKVTLAIGTNPGGGTLTGGGQVTVTNGVATYSGLSINKTGTGYTLSGTDTTGAGGGHPYTSATSSAFNVTPGAATKLVFTAQPSNTVAGATITPAVTVSVEDANNNVVTTDNSTKVTLAIGTNPASGTLTGGGQVTVVSGVATYSGLSINNAGNSYTLTATDTTGAGGGHPYTSATSNAFNITSTSLVYTATGAAQTWTTAVPKNVSYPAGTNTNDLLLLVYVAASNKVPTVPAAWTLLTAANQGGNIETRVYWKLAAAADLGAVSVTPSDTAAFTASAWVVQYVRPSGYPPNPAVATAAPNSAAANAATSVTTLGVTTNAANATVISIVGQAQATTALALATANGYALKTQTSANGLSFGLADEFVGTSGTATSAPVWSSSPTSAAWAWSTDAFH